MAAETLARGETGGGRGGGGAGSSYKLDAAQSAGSSYELDAAQSAQSKSFFLILHLPGGFLWRA